MFSCLGMGFGIWVIAGWLVMLFGDIHRNGELLNLRHSFWLQLFGFIIISCVALTP